MMMISLVDLRYPWDFKSTTSRRGTLYVHVPNALFLPIGNLFSPAASLFSRSWLRGMQEGRLYASRKFGSRPGSVARSLGAQSRANWQVITGSLSAKSEPTRPMETPKMSLFVLRSAAVY